MLAAIPSDKREIVPFCRTNIFLSEKTTTYTTHTTHFFAKLSKLSPLSCFS